MDYKQKITILFFVMITQICVLAQPAPCSGQSVSVLDNITNTSFKDTHLKIRTVQFKNMKNGSGDILNPENFGLVEQKLNCNPMVFKSGTKNRFYYSYPTDHGILIIENGDKKMYVIVPPYDSSVENEYFFSNKKRFLQTDKNIKRGETAFYYPNRYISGIDFKEGVFFVQYNHPFGFISFDRNEVMEFYPADKNDSKAPKNYWNQKVDFIAPFSGPGLQYSKAFEGRFSEQQALELIVKNDPAVLKKVLESSIENSKKNRELFDLLHNVLEDRPKIKQFRLKEKYDAGSVSNKEAYADYESFLKTEFFHIVTADSSLTLRYYNYFIDENSDLEKFRDFIKKNNATFTYAQLKEFIDTVR